MTLLVAAVVAVSLTLLGIAGIMFYTFMTDRRECLEEARRAEARHHMSTRRKK